MTSSDSSAASKGWRQGARWLADRRLVSTARRCLVGEDREGELRAVSGGSADGMIVRGPVAGLALGGAALSLLAGLGGWALVAGGLLGWRLGALIYRGAVLYVRPSHDGAPLRIRAQGLEVGDWLRVRTGGVVARVARVTSLDDVGAHVRVTLSNGTVKEWRWRERADVVSLRPPVPESWGPAGRCLYARAQEDLPAAWGLGPCEGPASRTGRSTGALPQPPAMARFLLCEAHAHWVDRLLLPGIQLASPVESPAHEGGAPVRTLPQPEERW
jgi:hypothetical protein